MQVNVFSTKGNILFCMCLHVMQDRGLISMTGILCVSATVSLKVENKLSNKCQTNVTVSV